MHFQKHQFYPRIDYDPSLLDVKQDPINDLIPVVTLHHAVLVRDPDVSVGFVMR